MRKLGSDVSKRGFTLVETITSVAIIGLILLLIGYEFDGALNHLLHNQSNRDLEANARVVMTKVTNRLHSGTIDPQLNPLPGPCPCADDVLLSPPGTSNVLKFIRVRPGSLDPASIIVNNNVPLPPYEIVNIQVSAGSGVGPLVDKLIETDTNPVPPFNVISTETLGDHVTRFVVNNRNNGGPSTHDTIVDITITTASYSARCNSHCTFDMTNSFFIGGKSLQ